MSTPLASECAIQDRADGDQFPLAPTNAVADFHNALELAGCFDSETGAVNLDAVNAKAQELLQSHPHYASGRNTPTAVPASVVTSATPTTHVPVCQSICYSHLAHTWHGRPGPAKNWL